MGTPQIIGFVLLGIVALIVLMSHIFLVKSWNDIKVGDIGIYTNEQDSIYDIEYIIKVIKKENDYIVIQYDDMKETIYRYEYLAQRKIIKWDKDGKTN